MVLYEILKHISNTIEFQNFKILHLHLNFHFHYFHKNTWNTIEFQITSVCQYNDMHDH
jgi:hypothetical protein